MRVAETVEQVRQHFRKGTFQVNVLLLAGGTTLSQGLLVVASPILTRLYTPADYGAFAVYTFFFSILLAVNSLRYEFAIPLPDDDDSAINVVVLVFVLVIITTILFSVLTWLFGAKIAILTKVPELTPYLWLLPICLLFAGFYMGLDYWSTRKKTFGKTVTARVSQSIVQIVTQIGVHLAVVGPLGLIVGQVVGQLVAAFQLARGSGIFAKPVTTHKLITLAKIYKNFPLFTMWSSLIDLIGQQIPALLFAAFFRLEEAGYFSLTMRMLSLPSTLIGAAVAQTFYPTIIARRDDPAAVRQTVEKLATILWIVGLTAFALVGLHGSVLFSEAFGDKWLSAGRYAQYFSPWFVLAFVTSPLSAYALVRGKQKQVLWLSATLMLLRLTAISIGMHFGSADLACILFSAVGVFIYVIYFAWILRLAGAGLLRWIGQIKWFLFSTGIVLIVAIMASHWLGPLPSTLFDGALLGLSALWFWRRYSSQYGG